MFIAQEKIYRRCLSYVAHIHIQQHATQTHITDTPYPMVPVAIVDNNAIGHACGDADARINLRCRCPSARLAPTRMVLMERFRVFQPETVHGTRRVFFYLRRPGLHRQSNCGWYSLWRCYFNVRGDRCFLLALTLRNAREPVTVGTILVAIMGGTGFIRGQ